MVFDALSRAGGRLLTRQFRGQFNATPKHELHTVIPVLHDTATMNRLTEGSFQFSENIAHAFGMEAHRLDDALRAYVDSRLRLSIVHDRQALREYLARA